MPLIFRRFRLLLRRIISYYYEQQATRCYLLYCHFLMLSSTCLFYISSPSFSDITLFSPLLPRHAAAFILSLIAPLFRHVYCCCHYILFFFFFFFFFFFRLFCLIAAFERCCRRGASRRMHAAAVSAACREGAERFRHERYIESARLLLPTPHCHAARGRLRQWRHDGHFAVCRALRCQATHMPSIPMPAVFSRV